MKKNTFVNILLIVVIMLVMGETLQKVESHVESHRSAHAFSDLARVRIKKNKKQLRKKVRR